MAPDEWDLRVALKQYSGKVDAEVVHNTLANHINGPFFTCKQVPDGDVQAVVRRIWEQFDLVNYQLFRHDGREYLGHLMDLAVDWRIHATDDELNQSQRALLRFNSALILMCVTEVLNAHD